MNQRLPLASNEAAQPYFDPSLSFRRPMEQALGNSHATNISPNAPYYGSASSQHANRLYDPERIPDSSEYDDWHSEHSPTENQLPTLPRSGNGHYEYNEWNGSGSYGDGGRGDDS
jgi:hypothetical protein